MNQGHVLAGAIYYGWARANDFGPIPSLLFAIATSAAWEYLMEFREYVSLNDLVISPYGGQAMGEVLYKWGELYRVMGDSLGFGAKALTIAFAAPRAIHTAFDDERVTPWSPADGPPMQHEFRAAAGAVLRTRNEAVDGAAGTVALTTRVVDMPGWHMTGSFDTFYQDGNFTALDLEFGFDRDGVDRASIAARALIAGYYQQDINADGWGHALTLGLSRGAWLDLHDHVGLTDRIAMVDIAGPALVVDIFAGPVRATASLRACFDLGQVTPLAFDAYTASHGDAGVRSELALEGYTFAYGGNFMPTIALETGPLRAQMAMQYSRFRDFRGPDRIHKNDVPTPLHLLDTRLVIRTALEVDLYRGLGLNLRYDHTTRAGVTEDFVVTRKLQEIGAAVRYRF